MTDDPVIALAENEIVELAIDLQVQLEKGTATRPVLWLLSRARARAAGALLTLTQVDATDAKAIILLQNIVVQYSEMVEDCRVLLARGKEADRQLDENIRIEIADVLDLDEAREMGLAQTPEDL